MKLLQGEAFDELIRSSQHQAFHLEVQDDYNTEDGVAPFRNWVEGRTDDDYEWLRGWLDLVRDMTTRGAVVRRARVVTAPHTDYTRWLLEVSRENVASGEEIRYAPRHLVDPQRLTADDWWLLDDSTVAFTTFEDDGRFAGAAVTQDRRIVAYCQEVRDYVWEAATPYADYVALQTR